MAGERCGNQCFEKRLYPPLIPYRTETRGWGLKTLANIHKGKHFGFELISLTRWGLVHPVCWS